jgi:DHA2 family multidrug resistance protein
VLLFAMPVVGQLTTKVQARYIIAFGWLALALAMYYSTKRIDLLISFSSATWLRVAQVVGLAFLFVPITLAAYVGIPAEKSNSVAGLVNFMRNIGSSVGTSLVTTLVARRSQFHQSVLVSHTTPGNQTFQGMINGLAKKMALSGMSLPDAQRQAYARIYRAVQAQAATLAYIDTYWVLAVGAAIMFCLSFVLKKNDPRAGGAAAVG